MFMQRFSQVVFEKWKHRTTVYFRKDNLMQTQFHTYLTASRKQRGFTPTQIADRVKVSVTTYLKYEEGVCTPDYAVLEQIADTLDCSLDELFGRRRSCYSDSTGVISCVREEIAPYGAVSQKKKAKLFIGVQDFRALREKKASYVDKTQFIEEFLDSCYQITLITRPRRFGKSLNMSMLAEFLDCTRQSADIFKGTRIEKSACIGEMNQHPVIFLSFLNVKAGKAETMCFLLRSTIHTEYRRYYEIFMKGTLPEKQKIRFRQTYDNLEILSEEEDANSFLIESIAVLCETLYMYYGKKVYLILDEYDTPFMSANAGGYYDEVRELLKGILTTSLKGNPYLEKAVLTGVQRVAKENIFSGLNNLIVCTVRDRAYADCFGFTEKEVRELLHTHDMTFTEEVKAMYDGYRFGEAEVYNPWSVSCYVAEKRLDTYWVNTSENGIIRKALEAQGKAFKRAYERLIREGSVNVLVDFSMAWYETLDEAAVWGLLVNAGMATVEEVIDGDYCKIRVPNLEVWKVFKELTAYHLGVNERHMEKMFYGLKHQELDLFAEEYQNILLELPSYYDLKDENSYHMMMLGMWAFLRKEYTVKSNRESGTGRSDICLYSKKEDYPNIILEFKYTKNEKEDLSELAEKAIRQSREKQYAAEMKGKVVYIGLAHYKKQVYVCSKAE